VRAHIPAVEEQESMLDCLGLLDLVEPSAGVVTLPPARGASS
jgi:hypothetical protein